MKLQTKLVLAFFIGLAVVTSIAQGLQYLRVSSLLDEFAESNRKMAMDMVESNARNIFHSVERSLAGTLQRGEMEKFDRILQEQKSIEGLQEFALYDREGKLFSTTESLLRDVKLSPDHPNLNENNRDITANCIRCHKNEKIKIDFVNKRDLPNAMKEYLMRSTEMFVRHSHETIEIFQPLMVTGDCVRCHRDWPVGKMAGSSYFRFSKAALVKMEEGMAETVATIRGDSLRMSILLIVGIMITLVPIAYFYTRHSLVLRLQRLGQQIQSIAGGDLSQRIGVPKQLDEISVIAAHVNTMADNLANTARSVGVQAANVGQVVSNFEEVRAVLLAQAANSSGLAAGALRENQVMVGELTTMGQNVANADNNIDVITVQIESLSANVGSVAAAAETASQSVMTMASAAEQMTVNLADVSKNLIRVNDSVAEVTTAMEQTAQSLAAVRQRCQLASSKSEEADRNATAASQVMAQLTASANEIGAVVEVINGIAEQTNMLSLNAAIEAAGAGDAGKGFAVVANEVKELARQTTEATKLIADKIYEIRTSTERASESAQGIARLVKEINQANNEISGAVDEQNITINRVADSMRKVSHAAETVTRNTQELELSAREVTRAATDAATGTNHIARSSGEMAAQAEVVSRQIGSVQTIMGMTTEVANATVTAADGVQTKMAQVSAIVDETQQSIHALSGLGQVMQLSRDQLVAAQGELDRLV